jgi:hypothetical protein
MGIQFGLKTGCDMWQCRVALLWSLADRGRDQALVKSIIASHSISSAALRQCSSISWVSRAARFLTSSSYL